MAPNYNNENRTTSIDDEEYPFQSMFEKYLNESRTDVKGFFLYNYLDF